MTQLKYFQPTGNSPFTVLSVSGNTVTIATVNTSTITAGMSVANTGLGINTTVNSIVDTSRFTVANSTGITNGTVLNIGTWVSAVVGAQGYQGAAGSPGGAQGAQGNQGGLSILGTSTLAPGSNATVVDSGTSGNSLLYFGIPRGYQGYQGYQGNQGYQSSVQGPQGFQGYQGAQGNQGYQSSIQGPQGYQGSQGYQGPQGNQGIQGSQGLQGTQGYQGYQGTQGYQGVQGYQGLQGAQGYQGNQGNQGYQSGVQGYQGFQGPQGYQGSQGTQGFQGTQGGIVPATSANSPAASGTVGTSPSVILNSNAARKQFWVTNTSTTSMVYLAMSASGAAINCGIALYPGQQFSTIFYSGTVSAISTANNTIVAITEI